MFQISSEKKDNKIGNPQNTTEVMEVHGCDWFMATWIVDWTASPLPHPRCEDHSALGLDEHW